MSSTVSVLLTSPVTSLSDVLCSPGATVSVLFTSPVTSLSDVLCSPGATVSVLFTSPVTSLCTYTRSSCLCTPACEGKVETRSCINHGSQHQTELIPHVTSLCTYGISSWESASVWGEVEAKNWANQVSQHQSDTGLCSSSSLKMLGRVGVTDGWLYIESWHPVCWNMYHTFPTII